jgi:hypothetical protein
MMPVPSHLKGIAVPRDPVADQEPLTADIRCSCGESTMELLYPGQTHRHEHKTIPCTAEIDGNYFFVVRARCTRCSTSHLLLDADFHGWNGFVCHDQAQASLAPPALIPWRCQSCAGTSHKVVVHIQTEGRQDFVNEAGEGFDAQRWPDAFGWFDLDLTCIGCGENSRG